MSGQSESAAPRAHRRYKWLVVGLTSLILAACAKTPPEQALRDAVTGLQAAVEARDASAVQSFLAEDFIGPDGLDRDGARRMATLYLMRHDNIGMTVGPLAVQMQEDHARVDFTVAVTGGSGRLLPESGQVYAVRSGWRIEDGDWKMTSVSWEPEL
jgi:ketosteroid isomerase-like protein